MPTAAQRYNARMDKIFEQARRNGAIITPAVERFNRIWDALETVGLCDGRNGSEYRRVLAEWQDACQPLRVAAFIEDRANFTP